MIGQKDVVKNARERGGDPFETMPLPGGSDTQQVNENDPESVILVRILISEIET